MAHNGAEKVAQEKMDEVRAELKEFGREARHRAEDVKKEAVKQLHNAADTMRREARQLNADKDVVEHVDKVAKGLERAAHYLSRSSVEDLGEDVTRKVKRNPWQTVAIFFVIGVIVGLILRGDND